MIKIDSKHSFEVIFKYIYLADNFYGKHVKMQFNYQELTATVSIENYDFNNSQGYCVVSSCQNTTCFSLDFLSLMDVGLHIFIASIYSLKKLVNLKMHNLCSYLKNKKNQFEYINSRFCCVMYGRRTL